MRGEGGDSGDPSGSGSPHQGSQRQSAVSSQEKRGSPRIASTSRGTSGESFKTRACGRTPRGVLVSAWSLGCRGLPST